ncbi:MAG: glycosyltransferase [Actinomycetota bacterium]|nr:glycosyltransferase [Actinomycetota bacterium]
MPSTRSDASLSICIPTYNRPDMFERALSSVLGAMAETFEDVEVVVSDNSTNDETEDVYRRRMGSWVGASRYVHNRPPTDAIENFNRCISLAAGEWVHILHDDDYLVPDGGQRMLQAIRSAGEQRALLFGIDVVDEHGRIRQRQRFRRLRDLSPEQALRRVLSDSSFVRFPAIVVRRDAYAALGPFNGEMANLADLDMWVRLFSRYGVRCVPSTTCAYTIHPAALSDAMFHPATIAGLSAIFGQAARRGVLDPAEVRRLQARFLHQFILSFTYRRLRGGDRRGARQTLRLFDIASVRSLGPSPRWLPVRYAFRAATVGAPVDDTGTGPA